MTRLILTSALILIASTAWAAGVDLRVNWLNPTPVDNATTMTVELGSGPGPADPTNFAPVAGSPFAPTATTVNLPALAVGTRYCVRWIRKTAQVTGDPIVVCGTSDQKPGNVGGVQFIFTPNPLATPPAASQAAPKPAAPKK